MRNEFRQLGGVRGPGGGDQDCYASWLLAFHFTSKGDKICSDPFSLYFHMVPDFVELKYRPGIADLPLRGESLHGSRRPLVDGEKDVPEVAAERLNGY